MKDKELRKVHSSINPELSLINVTDSKSSTKSSEIPEETIGVKRQIIVPFPGNATDVIENDLEDDFILFDTF
jgi:hypothetical protein